MSIEQVRAAAEAAGIRPALIDNMVKGAEQFKNQHETINQEAADNEARAAVQYLRDAGESFGPEAAITMEAELTRFYLEGKESLEDQARKLAEQYLAEGREFKLDPTDPTMKDPELLKASYILQASMEGLENKAESSELGYLLCKVLGIETTTMNVMIAKMALMLAMRKGAAMSGYASAQQAMQMFGRTEAPGASL